MWPFKKQVQAQSAPIVVRPTEPVEIDPLAMRRFEIEQEIERGFWKAGSKAGAFRVVAKMLAEQEARLNKIESEKD